LAISLPLLAAASWTLVGSTHAAIADYHWRKVLPIETALVRANWQGSDAQFHDLLQQAQAAAEWEPANVEYQTWLGIYRWHNGLRESVWNPMTDEQRAQMCIDLIEHFQNCERLCPSYGLSYSMAGQIEYTGLQDKIGAVEIRKASTLAPTHPAVCFVAGRLDALEGKWDDAHKQFTQALALHYQIESVLNVYVNEVKRPDLAVEVFKDDWETLLTLANIMGKDPAFAKMAPEIRTQSENVLKNDAQKPEAPVQTLAAMADLLGRQGDLKEAIRYYRRALDGAYANAQWHLTLANMLVQSGEKEQARQEVVISLREKQPPLSDAQRKVAEEMSFDLRRPPTTGPSTRE